MQLKTNYVLKSYTPISIKVSMIYIHKLICCHLPLFSIVRFLFHLLIQDAYSYIYDLLHTCKYCSDVKNPFNNIGVDTVGRGVGV